MHVLTFGFGFWKIIIKVHLGQHFAWLSAIHSMLFLRYVESSQKSDLFDAIKSSINFFSQLQKFVVVYLGYCKKRLRIAQYIPLRNEWFNLQHYKISDSVAFFLAFTRLKITECHFEYLAAQSNGENAPYSIYTRIFPHLGENLINKSWWRYLTKRIIAHMFQKVHMRPLQVCFIAFYCVLTLHSKKKRIIIYSRHWHCRVGTFQAATRDNVHNLCPKICKP